MPYKTPVSRSKRPNRAAETLRRTAERVVPPFAAPVPRLDAPLPRVARAVPTADQLYPRKGAILPREVFPIMAAEFPKTAEGLVERSDDFLDVAEKTSNAGVFNLDAPALADWRAKTDAMQVKIDRRTAIRLQLDAIDAEIQSAAPELEKTARNGLKVAAASPANNGLKAEAGVTIPKARVNSAPITPTELLATPDVNSTVTLKCNRADNIRGAKFVFEKKTGADWFLLDIVTATELTVPAKIGEKAVFRVSARNGQGTSLPSNEAIIYDS